MSNSNSNKTKLKHHVLRTLGGITINRSNKTGLAHCCFSEAERKLFLLLESLDVCSVINFKEQFPLTTTKYKKLGQKNGKKKI